jgi:hypothetical protein
MLREHPDEVAAESTAILNAPLDLRNSLLRRQQDHDRADRIIQADGTSAVLL